MVCSGQVITLDGHRRPTTAKGTGSVKNLRRHRNGLLEIVTERPGVMLVFAEKNNKQIITGKENFYR